MIDEATQGVIKEIDADMDDIDRTISLINGNAGRLPIEIYRAGGDLEFAVSAMRDALDEYLESDDA